MVDSRWIILSVVCFTSAAAGCADKAVVGLDAPERLTLYSIDGRDFPQGREPTAKERFHRYPVLGKVEIASMDERAEIARALKVELLRIGSPSTTRFSPRHGIRAVQYGRTVDFLLCFEGDQAIVYIDGVPQRRSLTGNAERLFDRHLRKAALPLRPE